MTDLNAVLQENREARKRLYTLTSGLGLGKLNRRISNGWTVAMTLAHLAFWDLRQVTMIQRYLKEGVPPGSLDADAVNAPLSVLSKAVPPAATVKLAQDAARTIDREIEKLTPAQFKKLLKLGLERNLRRSLHRKHHLDKVEKILRR